MRNSTKIISTGHFAESAPDEGAPVVFRKREWASPLPAAKQEVRSTLADETLPESEGDREDEITIPWARIPREYQKSRQTA